MRNEGSSTVGVCGGCAFCGPQLASERWGVCTHTPTHTHIAHTPLRKSREKTRQVIQSWIWIMMSREKSNPESIRSIFVCWLKIKGKQAVNTEKRRDWGEMLVWQLAGGHAAWERTRRGEDAGRWREKWYSNAEGRTEKLNDALEKKLSLQRTVKLQTGRGRTCSV